MEKQKNNPTLNEEKYLLPMFLIFAWISQECLCSNEIVSSGRSSTQTTQRPAPTTDASSTSATSRG